MNRYRAGIIGCGNIGGRYDERENDDRSIYTHAGMYRSASAIDLICAADPNTERLEAFGRFWSPVKCYRDYKKMLGDEALDIVSIATPDETHCGIILDILRIRAPRVIFTEKPLAMNMEEALMVNEACRQKSVCLIVDYVRRWDENHRRVRDMVLKGSLGTIQSVVGYYVRGFRHNGCQMINTLQFLFGTTSSVQVIGDSNAGSFAGDPSLDVALEFESGIPARVISLDKFGYGYSIFEIDIFGKNGRLRLLDGGQRIEYCRAVEDAQFPNFSKLAVSDSDLKEPTYGKALLGAGSQMVAILSGETDRLENTARDAIDDLCVIEAAFASANSDNKKIRVQRYHE
jgi:predicted dehydrogenase